MKPGDLVTTSKIFDTKTSKIGIIISEDNNHYKVKWLFVPLFSDLDELESKYRLSLTQYYYKNVVKNALFKVKDVLGKD
mgnify:CR=1 FL=1|tara:strand:- start:259 stop:495 length:237 start_codon:yes stop_codon:yes gene_type:complete